MSRVQQQSSIGDRAASPESRFSPIVEDHPDMRDVVESHSTPERVYSTALWCEGPAWSTRLATLIFSDVRKNAIMALGPHGDAKAIRTPSNFANGNAFDTEGRLVTCEHLQRRVVRQEHDGRITVLADHYDGRRLNSPNDVIVANDGGVWFTDPTFGLTVPQEGRTAVPEQRGRFVFRIDPGGGIDVVSDSFEQPNGLALSPDEKRLYVTDASGVDGREGSREIRVFDVLEGRRLVNERLFATVRSGVPDGLDVDEDGRLYAACDDGVRIWRSDGQLLGRIATASTCGNLAFGGSDRKRLYLCTGETMHAINLKVAGANKLG